MVIKMLQSYLLTKKKKKLNKLSVNKIKITKQNG